MIRRSATLTLLIAISGCEIRACSSDNATMDDIVHDLPRLSRELALPLPIETKVVWAQHETGIDDMTRAKVTMSTAAFARLAPSLPLKPEDLMAGPGELGPDYKGWDPDATPGMRSGEAQLEGGRFLHFGYAERDGGVTLFVVNFGT